MALVGKSLGTLAMGHLLTSEGTRNESVRAVWLTPLLRQVVLREQVRRYGGPCLFAIGTADPHYDPPQLDELCRATGGGAVVVEGADHGLDFVGDVVGSTVAVQQVIGALYGFFSG